MKFTANNNIEYIVRWKHDPTNIEWDDPVLRSLCTGKSLCWICAKSSPDQISDAIAYCSDTDVFNKNIGRKISFARALNTLFPDSKENRSIAWQAYFDENPKRKKS